MSTQAYNRYAYVGNNPLSANDPTGYFTDPDLGKVIGDIGPILSVIPGCQGWCTAAVMAISQAISGYAETGSAEQGARQGAVTLAAEGAFYAAGTAFGDSATGWTLVGRSATEGIIGGLLSQSGGGRFGDEFIGSFTGSESDGLLNQYDPIDGSTQVEVERITIKAMLGGTVSDITGGNFGDAAIAAAMQELFNDKATEDRNEKLCGDPAGCTPIHGANGIIVAWVSSSATDDITKYYLKAQAGEPDDYEVCDSSCKARIKFGVGTALSLFTDGASLAYGLRALTVDEGSAAAVAAEESAQRASGLSAGISAISLLSRPTFAGTLTLGLSVLGATPLNPIGPLVDVFGLGFELNEAAGH